MNETTETMDTLRARLAEAEQERDEALADAARLRELLAQAQSASIDFAQLANVSLKFAEDKYGWDGMFEADLPEHLQDVGGREGRWAQTMQEIRAALAAPPGGALTELRARERAAERERCCGLVCFECGSGHTPHLLDGKWWHAPRENYRGALCQATYLRALPATPADAANK